MADYERETYTTTNDDLPPADREERVTYVRDNGNAGPWLIAAVVAVVAIIAVAWLMMDSSPDDEEIAAAMDASRSAGYVEGANSALSQQPLIIPAPDTGAADYAARTAADAAQAASEARAAAEQAAESADDAAANASATVRDNSVVGEPVG